MPLVLLDLGGASHLPVLLVSFSNGPSLILPWTGWDLFAPPVMVVGRGQQPGIPRLYYYRIPYYRILAVQYRFFLATSSPPRGAGTGSGRWPDWAWAASVARVDVGTLPVPMGRGCGWTIFESEGVISSLYQEGIRQKA